MTVNTERDVGIQVVRGDQLSGATAQTSGMTRLAAVAPETTGNHSLWMGGDPAGHGERLAPPR